MEKNRKALKYLFSKTESNLELDKTNNSQENINLTAEENSLSEQFMDNLDIPKVASQTNINNIRNRTIEEQEKILIETISNLNKNFDNTKESRQHWAKEQYINLIQNLDLVQSEGFFLKGHLLDEIKNKFFINNKNGWVKFAEESLSMNYTTANQYIRVAKEFDVLSHQRSDFMFEHYKALLPANVELREKIITEAPFKSSVPKIKEMLTQNVDKNTKNKDTPISYKNLINSLIQIQEQLDKTNFNDLVLNERWQIQAACQNIGNNLIKTAKQLQEHNTKLTLEE